MKVWVSLSVDQLLRDLRLTGHALAEAAERRVRRGGRRDGVGAERQSRPGAEPAGKGKRS